MKNEIYYRLVLSMYGETPNSYCPENFNTQEQAKEYYLINYKNRNKGDEYDKYWNSIPLIIQQVITNTIFVVNES